MNYFSAETPDNYEQKCLCILVLDTSSSMDGQPINELNNGLQEFYRAIQRDEVASERLEIAIITFDSNVNVALEPQLIDNFDMPRLRTTGSTQLVDGVRLGIEKIEKRKEWYKETGQPYYRPIMVLITDGEPDYDQDIDGLSIDVDNAVNEKKLTFFGLGVRGYNHKKLAQICPVLSPPLPLDGYKFEDFFKWLSNSISVITSTHEGEINLPPISGWTQMEI